MNSELFDKLKDKYRKQISDKRVQVESCRDFQLVLANHLRSHFRKIYHKDIKIESFLKVLEKQERKLTQREKFYLLRTFKEVFSSP